MVIAARVMDLRTVQLRSLKNTSRSRTPIRSIRMTGLQDRDLFQEV